MESETVYKPVIGQKVYQHYRPGQAGVIVKILELKPQQYFHRVWVHWVNGETSLHSAASLSDFDALIFDHEHKLQTHLKMRERLDALTLDALTADGQSVKLGV